jgi:hypothetical protein
VKVIALVAGVGVLLLAGIGCGSSGTSSSESARKPTAVQLRAQQHARRQTARRRAILHHRARVRARHLAAQRRAHEAHRAKVRQEHREEAEARQLALAEERKAEEAEAIPEESSECDPNYSGACLDPYSSDYDCKGGSGNGPDYTGTVTVVGEDHYGLDADGDGTGCEAG